ncbi:MAG: hypothetical protein JNL39_06210, partial [Opitutaceae bacterium]|nr:hypothetical protein [Opitutaceae bacterium]
GQLGLSVEAYLRFVQQITISVLAIVSAAVQGGMFLYYWRRRSAIQQALAPM